MINYYAIKLLIKEFKEKYLTDHRNLKNYYIVFHLYIILVRFHFNKISNCILLCCLDFANAILFFLPYTIF